MPFLPVRKAVLPAAGLGTRFLPATKASPKEMLALGDEVIDAPIPGLAQLIKIFQEREGPVLGVKKVPSQEVSRYGIVANRRIAPGLHRVEDLIEKPDPKHAPSRYAVIGRYVLSPD